MELVIKNPNTAQPIKHQLIKVVLGSIAAFAATKLVENAYDKVLEKTDDDTTVIEN